MRNPTDSKLKIQPFAKLFEHLRTLGRGLTNRQSREMRLCETLPLGEKRFLALVMIGDRKLLVGGAANSISLLAECSSGLKKNDSSRATARTKRRRTRQAHSRQKRAALGLNSIGQGTAFKTETPWALPVPAASLPAPRTMTPQ
ncbi:MAG TPA: flagellar biosynthetic protein FliO [Terriglobia bacterium]|nr:flagellar biosynthetic protein FliO [Terriglobia bacterium]